MKLRELTRGLNKFQVMIGYGNKRDWQDVELPANSLGQVIDDLRAGNSLYLSTAVDAVYSSTGKLQVTQVSYDSTDDKGAVHLRFFGSLDSQDVNGTIKLRSASLLERGKK